MKNNLTIAGKVPPITDSTLQTLALESQARLKFDISNWKNRSYEEFKEIAISSIVAHKYNEILGLDLFPYTDIIQGNQHFIDNLLIQHSMYGIQTFEHDYNYYKKLIPNIKYAKLGELNPIKPLIIAAPVPGYMDLHPQWTEILEECESKNIPVHVDGAWYGCSHGLTIDLRYNCIQSFSVSFSKAWDLGWNRVSVRWRKNHTIDNAWLMSDHRMISHATVEIAKYFAERLPIDYVIDTYLDKYNRTVRELKLRPGKVIHVASSIDRKTLYGLKNLLTS
jgi:hypothetical protein